MPNGPWLRLSVLVAGMIGAACGRSSPADDRPEAAARSGIIDHHVHLLGPDIMRDWRAIGVTFSRADSVYTGLVALNNTGADSIALAVLVPMGHLYATEDFAYAFKLDRAEEAKRVARENDHVAAQAARFPGRAVALCSAPALREYAMAEFARCRDSLGVAGIKLHLASSQVDFRDTAHLAAISRIVAWATESDLPLLVHVDPQRRGLDSLDVKRFVREVIGPLPRATIVIAHLGGSGGYGGWTRTVFGVTRRWQDSVERAEQRPRALYYDLSAVVLEAESEGVPATTPEQITQLAADLREAGMSRLVFGSDYPVFDAVRGVRVLREKVGLTDEEVAAIRHPSNGSVFTRGTARRSPSRPSP
ncbi:MAG: amidohydrolase family protein [Gemmatimonadaceae bacterium]